MPRAPRKIQITRQQKHIILLALFLLKYEIKQYDPEKKQVLNFIRLRKLIQIRDEDRILVSTGEEAWENSLAWQRSTLRDEGLLTMPQRGIWKITPLGEESILEWCALLHHFTLVRNDWQDRIDTLEALFEEKIVLTKETIIQALSAYEMAIQRFPDNVPKISDEIKGKMQL